MKADMTLLLEECAREDVAAGALDQFNMFLDDAADPEAGFTAADLRRIWTAAGADLSTLPSNPEPSSEQPKKKDRFAHLDFTPPSPWNKAADGWRIVPKRPWLAYSISGGCLRHVKKDGRSKVGLLKRRFWRGRALFETRENGKRVRLYEQSLAFETGRAPFGFYPGKAVQK